MCVWTFHSAHAVGGPEEVGASGCQAETEAGEESTEGDELSRC